MSIDVEPELKEILQALEFAKGYIECENVILVNIKKQLALGIEDHEIIKYLESLLHYFVRAESSTFNKTAFANYLFVGALLRTLLTMPYWKSLISTMHSRLTAPGPRIE
jgi:hypothetical protein